MADLSTMFPQTDALGGWAAGQVNAHQQAQAIQNNAINQENALFDLYKNRQMLPLEMENKRANTDLAASNAYHAKALGANGFYDLEAKERLKEPTYRKALSDLMAQTSENDIKQIHAQIEKDLMSPDEKVRTAAKTRFMATGDMLKMYEHLRIQGENAARVAGINGQSRVDAVTARGAGASAPKPPATMEAQYNDYFRRSQDNSLSEAERTDYAGLADTVMKNIIAKGNAKAPAMVIGPEGRAIPNPTTTPGTITPTPTPGEAKPQHTLAQLKTMYPGRTDAELKAAYKAKYKVDLQ